MARAVLASGGRIVIPAEYRRALGMCVGDRLFIDIADGELRILTPQQAIKRAQELLRPTAAEDGRSFVDELIADAAQRPSVSKCVLDAFRHGPPGPLIEGALTAGSAFRQ